MYSTVSTLTLHCYKHSPTYNTILTPATFLLHPVLSRVQCLGMARGFRNGQLVRVHNVQAASSQTTTGPCKPGSETNECDLHGNHFLSSVINCNGAFVSFPLPSRPPTSGNPEFYRSFAIRSLGLSSLSHFGFRFYPLTPRGFSTDEEGPML